MNKILHINISGQVIAIEAPAYEALQAYLASLRRYFADEDGCEEIINDIEGRIAEVLGAKIAAGTPAVSVADVEEVAQAMGRPADFAREANAEAEGTARARGGAEGFTGGASTSASIPDAPPAGESKRMYRDTRDRVLGGVCSGIANYLGVDTTLVRALFALVTLGGFGLGILMYVALWSFLPERALDGAAVSRLYRDPDDRILGGVASGIARYLNREPKWVRMILIAPIAINAALALIAWVIFVFGGDVAPALISSSLIATIAFAYLVMWVVLPEATTPYEKLRMRGQPIDINEIKQRVQAGLAVARRHFEGAHDRLRRTSQAWQATPHPPHSGWHGTPDAFAATGGGGASESGANANAPYQDAEYVEAPRPFASAAERHPRDAGRDAGRARPSGLAHVAQVMVQVLLLAIAGAMAFTLFFALIALAVGAVALWPARAYLFSGAWQEALTWSTMGLFVFVPALGIVLWLFRRAVGARPSAALGWSFGGLWTLGWASAVLLAVSVARDVRAYEASTAAVAADVPMAGDVLSLVAKGAPPAYKGWWNDGEIEGWDLDDQSLRLAYVGVEFRKSADVDYHVQVAKYAAGQDTADAVRRAAGADYHAHWRGSTLELGSAYAIAPRDKFRGQRVEVIVEVPAGKRVRVDEALAALLAGPWNHGGSWGDDRELDDEGRGVGGQAAPRWRRHRTLVLAANTDYVMTDAGVLIMAPPPAGVASATVDAQRPAPQQ